MTTPATPTDAPPHDDDARSGADLLAQLLAAGVATPPNLSRSELLTALRTHRLEAGDTVVVCGAFERLAEGFGFVRSPHFDYEPGPHDAFVSPSQVRALNLKSGHRIAGPVRGPRGSERYFALTHIRRVGDHEPPQLASALAFDARTPLVATRPLALPEAPPWRQLAALAPWSRGHRVLVVAPPTWPRATWLTGLAAALQEADAELRCMVVLVDQRPEDLAAARSRGASLRHGEVVGTTFDQPPERHTALAEFVLARAMREVEGGHDVVLLFDSLTALATAAQRSATPSGRWLCPGLDAQAVLPGKRLFAAARACAEGGSLTVVATVCAGDGAVAATVRSEFRYRGNSEVVLDEARAAADAAAPFDPAGTRTRPEDDVRPSAAKAAAAALRRQLAAAASPPPTAPPGA